LAKEANVTYECVNHNCGNVEPTTYAPTTTKRCPKCNAMMVRKGK